MMQAMANHTNGSLPDGKESASNKRMSVERIYQKKTQLEHILLRPDTYIGSTEPLKQSMWVYDSEAEGMVRREIEFVPGLYKIFDEILVNAADNKQRDSKMDTIKIDIDAESNVISIYNNGQGIPIVEHKVEKMYVPSLIFGHLLTSSNYNDEEKKVTGGRNGYGAKLCNIFSKKFSIETASRDTRQAFKQTWSDNMAKCTDPKIKSHSGEDFTRVTFSPDLAKFKMTELDKDTVALLSRRAYDVAGTSKGVRVFLNGKRLPVKGFKDYVDQYLKGKEDDQGNPLKVVYEAVSERWEACVTLSDRGFQQVSFVNSIATTKGGRHVDYVTDHIVSKLVDVVKKKNKGGTGFKPFQVKNHMWVFLNCLIENPTFDSQTKENMTLQPKNFGSRCLFSEKFISQVQKCGIVESILTWVRFKQQTQLASKCHKLKHSKLRGIPKLEDANDAGTKNSINCTLILTEGDSAKSLAVSGLGVVGRDTFGVFPLRGKILNVREATHKQILENAEINNVIKIMGLQYKKKYESKDDLKSLRYGSLMIMTDQDQDGSHIKGLIINFIHHNWPSLLQLPFLEEFITPIVKATKRDRELSFYSLPEFEEWKRETEGWHLWKIKYYKGLGTSTAKEAKEYFTDMDRHRIKFKYGGADDDNSIRLAFSKKMVDQRKEWLTNGMEERKQRKELGLPELYLYGKETKAVSYQDFVNKELILFSNMDNERSIPSLVDGMKPGQRKVLFTCFKRNDKREIKVAQLAGSVAEHSAYHHGEQSLMTTIIGLAQNYVGSNNINVLQPLGQFGTRLQGGKDAASPRYIFTMLSPLARHLFNIKDEPLLDYLNEDNQRIEPDYYVPIIPMVLVNGCDGIGTGWMTRIPNYNPREIVANIQRLMEGKETIPMLPWFKNFRGTIEQLDHQRFVMNGEIGILDDKSIEITELPVRVWTQAYKESTLEPMLHGSDKIQPYIVDYKEYHTDTTVRFVVSMSEDKVARSDTLHKAFKLQSTISTTSMVLFDQNGCLRKYETVDDILKEFFALRLDFYEKRKDYLKGILEAEALRLTNQARFILEKIERKISVENRARAAVVVELRDRGYDPDPVKAWKEHHTKSASAEQAAEEVSDSEDDEAASKAEHDFDYLLHMQILSLTKEKKEQLLKERDIKRAELEELLSKTGKDLWTEDLNHFMEELDSVEQKELEDEQLGIKGVKPAKSGKGAGGGRSKASKNISEELKPSIYAERVIPMIDADLKKKAEKASQAGKARKKKETSIDTSQDSSDVKPKVTSEEKKKKSPPAPKPKVSVSKPKRKLQDFNSDISISGDSDTDFDFGTGLRERLSKRQSTLKPKFINIDMSGSEEDKEEDLHDGSDTKDDDSVGGSDEEVVNKKSAFDDLVGDSGKNSEKKKAAPPPKDDDEEDIAENESDAHKKSEDESDPELVEEKESKKAIAPRKRGRKKASSDVSEEEFVSKKKKSTAAPRKPVGKRKGKKTSAGSSDEEDGDHPSDTVVRVRSGRSRAPVKYNFGEDSDVDDDY